MEIAAYALIIGILVLVFGLILAFAVREFNRTNTPGGSGDPGNGSGVITCDPDELLVAYIQGTQREQAGCPQFTNNYIVDNSGNSGNLPQLFAKSVIANITVTGEQCCFFSDSAAQRTVVQPPFIYIGSVSGQGYTLTDLNQKPYEYKNGVTTFIVPVCTTANADCFSMIRFALDPSVPTGGLYKIYKFGGTAQTNIPLSSVTGTGAVGGVADPALTDDLRNTVFYVDARFNQIYKVTYRQTTIVSCTLGSGGYTCTAVPNITLPQFLQEIEATVLAHNQLYPIPGENPPLSAATANQTIDPPG